MISLAACALVLTQASSHQGWPDVKVTLASRAVRAEALVSDLAKIAGVSMRVAPPLKEEIVLLKAEAQPLQVVVTKLAAALDGQWRQERGVFILARSPSRLAVLLKEEQAEFAKGISRELERLQKTIRNETPSERFSKIAQTFKAASQSGATEVKIETPQSLLLPEIASLFTPKDLSELPLDVPVTFSDRPNSMQRAFPPAAQKAISRYIELEELLQGNVPQDLKSPTLMAWWNKIFEAAGDYGETLMIAQRSADGVWFSLGTYTSKGKLRGVTALTLGLDRQPPVSNLLPALGTHQLSESAFELVAPRTSAPPTGSVAFSVLSRPDEFEPLDFGPREAVEAIAAKMAAVNICARLGDDWFDSVRRNTSGRTLRLDGLCTLVTATEGCAISARDGWLTIVPMRPLRAERARLPRTSLAAFVNNATAEGAVSLRNYAVLRFSSSQSAVRSSLFAWFKTGLKEWRGIESSTRMQDPLAAFIGSISDSEWSALLRGQRLSVGSLPATSQVLFRVLASMSLFACSRDGEAQAIPDVLLTGTECLPVNFADVRLSLKPQQDNVVKFLEVPDTIASFMPLDQALDAAFVNSRIRNLIQEKTISSVSEMDNALLDIGSRSYLILEARIAPGILVKANLDQGVQWSSRRIRAREMADELRQVFFKGL